MRRDVFQAIADPTRRAILLLLAVQTMTPNALAEHFSTSRQSISKHIKVLTECELLSFKQDGREIYYEVQANKMKEIEQWLFQFKCNWESKFNQLDSILDNLKK